MVKMAGKPVDILICYPLPEAHLKALAAVSPRVRLSVHPEDDFSEIPAEIIAKTEVMLTMKDIPLPEAAPELRWIQFSYAGIDFMKANPLVEREDFQATTLSGANATKVAEYALMALLALGHKLPMMLQYQDKKIFPPDRWKRFQPKELRGSTVGLLGYGSIARELARLLQPLGVEVLATKNDLENLSQKGFVPEGTGDPDGMYFTRLYPPQALHSVIKASDFVVVCLPLTDRTKNVLGTREFKMMKPDAYLVGLGRGGQVDEDALQFALREKHIAGAVLDVFTTEPIPQESPLWNTPNLVITPHIAGNTGRYADMVFELFSENLQRYLAGEELLNVFDPKKGY
jgi:phosphoglycerate dehydrogenase-like enzyme